MWILIKNLWVYIVLIELLKSLGLDKKLEKYDFKEEISDTGNSSAIKAIDKESSEFVFIKFLLFPRHITEINKFKNEIYITKKQGLYPVLSCFPRYIEGGELIENYVYYFITEWIDGKTLKEKIYDLKDSNIREKLCLFYQVVRALTALLGVEHRDLHPNNIFIIEEKFSEFNRVGFYNNRISPGIKIIDFGEAVYPMSTQFDDSPDFLYDSYFQTGRKIIAAFNYIAPEFYLPILDGKYVRRLNENSDIWSLGIILYLILFNENLFTYADIGTYLQSMNNGEMQQNILEKSKKILELDHPSKYIIYKLFNGIMSVNYKERPDLGDIQIIFWHVINKEIVYSQSETMQLIERPIKFLTEKGEISEPDYD